MYLANGAPVAAAKKRSLTLKNVANGSVDSEAFENQVSQR